MGRAIASAGACSVRPTASIVLSSYLLCSLSSHGLSKCSHKSGARNFSLCRLSRSSFARHVTRFLARPITTLAMSNSWDVLRIGCSESFCCTSDSCARLLSSSDIKGSFSASVCSGTAGFDRRKILIQGRALSDRHAMFFGKC